MEDKIKKVEKAMKGCSWEEAREIGVRILARCMAFHVYMGDGFDFTQLLKDICAQGDKWVHEEGGSFVIAMAKQARKEEVK